MKFEVRTIQGAKSKYVEITVTEGNNCIVSGLLSSDEASELLINLDSCIEDIKYFFRDVKEAGE